MKSGGHMFNFPSKWFDFTNHKELKRIRRDINNTAAFKAQIALSVIIAIISFFMTESVHAWNRSGQIIFCAVLCLLVVLIFITPAVLKRWKLRRRCNVIIKGEDAVSIFDDEIVYNVLVACEYYNALKMIPKTELEEDIKGFYHIEIEYYITASIRRLVEFSSNSHAIFGNGKDKISKVRIDNIVCLINALIAKNDITLEDSLKKAFDVFCTCVKQTG